MRALSQLWGTAQPHPRTREVGSGWQLAGSRACMAEPTHLPRLQLASTVTQALVASASSGEHFKTPSMCFSPGDGVCEKWGHTKRKGPVCRDRAPAGHQDPWAFSGEFVI